jgi:DNA-binding NarL/FixJ family response regulator
VRSVRVLIVDDQAPFRAAAAAVVEATEAFVLAGAVASGEESLARLHDLAPDLVVMDVNMPGMDGIEAAALITARPQPPTVVLVSTRSRHEYADRIEECGASAYLEKSEFGPERLAAIWAAASTGSTASTVDSPAAQKESPSRPTDR